MKLNDTATGRWRVHTEASTYLLDMDARTVVRAPGPGVDYPAADLRRDHDVIPLLEVLDPIEVGEQMRLLLHIRTDGVTTVRTTTPVTSIEQA